MENREFRLVSFEFGKDFTGIVVADIRSLETFETVHMEVIEDSSKSKDRLMQMIKDKIDPFLKYIPHKCVVLLENCVSLDCWMMSRIQQKIKKHYVVMGIPCRYVVKGKELYAEAGAARVLKKLGVQAHLTQFFAYKRRQDLADALLAAWYAHKHPDGLLALPKKADKTKRNKALVVV